MSIGVAVAKGGKIALATDSQNSFGSLRMGSDNGSPNRIEKIGSSFLTWTGNGIYEDLLREPLGRGKGHSLNDASAVFQYFMRLWKRIRSDYSFVDDKGDDSESSFAQLDASFLVVSRTGIYGVTSKMCVTKFTKYWAIGSGQEYALGALHALYDGRIDAEALARRAVETAIRFNIYCGGEIELRTIKSSTTA